MDENQIRTDFARLLTGGAEAEEVRIDWSRAFAGVRVGGSAICPSCLLPDPHHGQGDGYGSCDCPRCRDCGAAPQECDWDCAVYDLDEEYDE